MQERKTKDQYISKTYRCKNFQKILAYQIQQWMEVSYSMIKWDSFQIYKTVFTHESQSNLPYEQVKDEKIYIKWCYIYIYKYI